MFYSTRDFNNKVSGKEAVLSGLSTDGGLFLPLKIKEYKVEEDKLNYSYSKLAKDILSLYFDDLSEDEISSIVDLSYNKDNFKDKIIGIKSFKNFSFLELFYGPTTTFKDMALTLLPHLMDTYLEKEQLKKKLMILTATSGDTGSAVLSGFSKSKNIEISVMYPDAGISKIQEKQMLSFTSPRERAYAIKDSNFDDCQKEVKSLLNKENSKYKFTSANSINVGRLLPQIIYYYKAYIDLVNKGEIKLGEKIDVVVPTGNFGNIFSCYLAKKMGLNIDKLICASNENKILTDFFNTGIYDLNRGFVKTNSPSMDILISSNFERLLSLILEDDKKTRECMNDLKEVGRFSLDATYMNKLSDFVSYSVSQEETLELIKDCYKDYNYLIDPHTAVGYGSYLKYKKYAKNHVVVVSTASPFKFPKTILEAFDIKNSKDEMASFKLISDKFKCEIPKALDERIHHNFIPYKVEKSEIERTLFADQIKIKVPATSANLGPGFDICGIALNLFNVFSFKKSNEFKLIGFNKKDEENNLVLKSYKYLFERLNITVVPVEISLLKSDVPYERGLGSSATCIISGLLGANFILKNALSKETILKYAIELEGHPDNVAPCLYGGFIAGYKEDNEYKIVHYPVNKNLHFIACIQNAIVSTEEARKILPKEMDYKNVIYNLSHIINLPKAFKDADLELLKDSVKDTIHTPYRINLIPNAKALKDVSEKYHLPLIISGSGSTMILISKDEEMIDKLKEEKILEGFAFKDLKVYGGCEKWTRITY